MIATGAKPVPLPIDGADALVGKGISYCATCDGNFFRDKDVIVVGGGDSAVADVVYLCRIAQTVHLVHRREELKASPWYAKQLKGIENLVAVSYTHLDVYKRQVPTACASVCLCRLPVLRI